MPDLDDVDMNQLEWVDVDGVPVPLNEYINSTFSEADPYHSTSDDEACYTESIMAARARRRRRRRAAAEESSDSEGASETLSPSSITPTPPPLFNIPFAQQLYSVVPYPISLTL